MDRIVTGHASDGRTTIVEIGAPVVASGLHNSRSETRVAWATADPCSRAATHSGTDVSAFPGAGEARFLILTLPPDFASPMHATQTIDFLVVVSGELWLVMEDGSERKLSPADSVIQRATSHAWQNRSAEPCVLAATMIGLKD